MIGTMSRRLLVLAVATASLGTGCIRATTDLVVNDDGSGTVDIVAAIDAGQIAGQDEAGLLGPLAGADEEQLCQQFETQVTPDSLPEGTEVDHYEQDGFCGSRIRFGFESTEELTGSLEAVDGNNLAGELVLEPDGDGWRFQSPLISPIDPDDLGIAPAMLGPFLNSVDVRYQATLPGEASNDHNATSVSGGTFEWVIDVRDPPEQLRARTTAMGPAAGGLAVPIAVGAAAVAAVGAGALMMTRRRGALAGGHAPTAGAGRSAPGDGGDEPWGPAPAPATLERDEPRTPWPTGATPYDPITPEPRWDPGRGAWVADHPTAGLLIHDDDSGEWRRAD
jgi:hypothetical protein